MNEGITVLLWLVLIGALAVPFIWVVWVFLKRMKAKEKRADNPPEINEAATRDETTKQ